MGRCPWCGDDPLYVKYHDEEWGRPCHDERMLFELLILEGAQAGLSWFTILKKRDNYRAAFDDFDARKIARYDERDSARLLADAGIVRNRLKIAATIANAHAYLKLRKEAGGLAPYLWAHVDGRPLQPGFQTASEVPARTALSDAISKDMSKRGFKFVGSTIVYAYMQAIGLSNDHLLGCPQHAAARAAATGAGSS
ncbi:MAG TPA: DNA-3-methyladenine glycosylase I [Rhodocyclaceae bacterium]|nr:DNA-3-methyladenine glycosylase I [Rhodocyclaceae bacterium]